MIRDVTVKQFDKFVDRMVSAVSLFFMPVHSKYGRNTLGQTDPKLFIVIIFVFLSSIHTLQRTTKQ